MSSRYKTHDVFISSRQKKKLESAVKSKRQRAVKIKIQSRGVKVVLLLTRRQIIKVNTVNKRSKATTITMSKRQMRANITFKGGFLSVLAGLAARALPSILGELASSLFSRATNDDNEDGAYIQKGGQCYRAHPVEGNGLFLSPHHGAGVEQGDGLFLKQGHNIYNGEGLLFGANSPFRHIPILGWIL